jgi:hypothetical protein
VTTPARLYCVTAHDASAPLRQGEILTNVRLLNVRLETLGTDALAADTITHPFAVILTQDCDLEQDYHKRFPQPQVSDKLIPCLLFCEVATAEELFGTVKRQGCSKAWDRIKQNNDVRYHFLQKVEAGCDRTNEGLPELAIDFKRYFTLPTAEVYRRVELGEAVRRCVLLSPYLEHLSTRFANYLCRVALPLDHASE